MSPVFTIQFCKLSAAFGLQSRPIYVPIKKYSSMWNELFGKLPSKNAQIPSSTPELLKKYGYPLEVYSDVQTEDKYLLEVHRIPYGTTPKGAKWNPKPPILLMHGLFGSSADFLLVGPQSSLGYLLADMGYDVWLGNARGTTYSNKHLHFDSNLDSDYWDFSWHQIGMYDLPAIFSLIGRVTGQEKLFYLGMSQGTTIFFVLTSQKPEFNDRVRLMVGLAPIVRLANMYSPLARFLAKSEPFLAKLMGAAGILKMPPTPLDRAILLWNQYFWGFTLRVMYQLIGDGTAQLNKKYLPVILANLPNRVSVGQLRHFAHLFNSSRFAQYDYGRAKNLKWYGTIEPPKYDLTKVICPVALFYSKGDWISQPEDVEKVAYDLPNCVYRYQISDPNFNHCDYIMAKDVVRLLYSEIFALLKKFDQVVLIE